MSQNILLVEGESDKKFFEEMCKMICLNVKVKVNTPKDHSAKRNGKQSACDLLKPLLDQLTDGSITRLAMVVDADFCCKGWGYTQTVVYITQKIIQSGYGDPSDTYSGLSFPHSDGLNNFGLWVMPDNKSEGMVEDWIAKAVKSEESPLLHHAINTVGSLPIPHKFKSIHKSKADMATWLAWQKLPGEGLHTVISDSLIDMQCPFAMQLINWLKHIYN